jgi:quercetin 2,3-dioxygenase
MAERQRLQRHDGTFKRHGSQHLFMIPDAKPVSRPCCDSAAMAEPVRELFVGREVSLGGSTVVRRLLPNLGRRLVGAWCFVDHYGPDDIANQPGMAVPPHPHIGLQTVSWLLKGEVHHRDSIGSDQVIRPGELGLMTAGRGIAHAEHSPVVHPALLHGVQLWIALPGGARDTHPTWEHHAQLPVISEVGLTATVIRGELAGATAPGLSYTPIVGADITLAPDGNAVLPLEADFEYAILTMSGELEIEDVTLTPGAMLYLGRGRRDLRLSSQTGAQVLLLGGEPFEEKIVMWWNFVARTGEEIALARERWSSGGYFGEVADGDEPTPAPPLPPGRLKPGGPTRRDGSADRTSSRSRAPSPA